MKRVTAVVLGGGRGTRLFPLTIARAKPALPFLGKYRLIDLPLSNCINSGINRIYVLTQFMSASLHRHIMQTYKFDAFRDGFVDILAAEQTPQGQDWFQGTADAVRATLKHTSYYAFEQMLILSGDHLYRMDYGELLRFHRRSGAQITIAACPVGLDEAPRHGLLKVDGQGQVTEFAEKPRDLDLIQSYCAPSGLFEGIEGVPAGEMCCLGSMGIYVFEPDVLMKSLADPRQTDFGREIITATIRRFKVMAYPFTGYWKDIGTIASFYEANLSMALPNPPFSLHVPRWPIYTHSAPLPPSRILRSEIRDSLVSDGSDITGATIVNSVVGERNIVREGCRLSETILLGADYYEGQQVLAKFEDAPAGLPPVGLGRNCRIERTIIDRNVHIGDGVVITAKPDVKEFRGADYWVRDGITIIPRGAVIPPGTVI